MSGQHTQSAGKEGLYTLPSPGVPGWRRGSSRVSFKTSSRTGAYACTKPMLGFPAASTSEDGFLREQSSSLTGRGCAITLPQLTNVRLPWQVRSRGAQLLGVRRVLKRLKIRTCLDAAPRIISLFLRFATRHARCGEKSPRGAGFPRPLGVVSPQHRH